VTGGERVRLGERARDRQPASRWRNTNARSTRPNRLRALYGTAMAANAAGDRAKAEHYFRELNRVADKADTPLPKLAEATPYLAR
jgi:hypothetical protein